jgi:hypothetical protein
MAIIGNPPQARMKCACMKKGSIQIKYGNVTAFSRVSRPVHKGES